MQEAPIPLMARRHTPILLTPQPPKSIEQKTTGEKRTPSLRKWHSKKRKKRKKEHETQKNEQNKHKEKTHRMDAQKLVVTRGRVVKGEFNGGGNFGVF